MTDWSDKQYFLNTVYERFFQGYSVKLADTMGIVYTPQEIVDFMCASVAEVLDKEFGKKLWSDDVYIIDPCTSLLLVPGSSLGPHYPEAPASLHRLKTSKPLVCTCRRLKLERAFIPATMTWWFAVLNLY